VKAQVRTAVPESGPFCSTVVAAFRAISVQLASGDERPCRAVIGIVALVVALGLDVRVDRIRDPLVSVACFMLWRSQILQPSECLSGGTGFGAVINVLRAALAAAVVGCVGGPVSGGGSLPGDGDADVDAEQSR